MRASWQTIIIILYTTKFWSEKEGRKKKEVDVEATRQLDRPLSYQRVPSDVTQSIDTVQRTRTDSSDSSALFSFNSTSTKIHHIALKKSLFSHTTTALLLLRFIIIVVAAAGAVIDGSTAGDCNTIRLDDAKRMMQTTMVSPRSIVLLVLYYSVL